jgi:hypothetical protein
MSTVASEAGPPIAEPRGPAAPTAQGTRVPESGGFSRFVEKVKNLKELIAMTVLLVSGFIWAVNYVATKAQVAEIRCMLQAQIDLLRSQTDLSIIAREMLDSGVRLEEIGRHRDKSGKFDNADLKTYTQLTLELDVLKKRRSDAETARRDLESKLQRNGCSTP